MEVFVPVIPVLIALCVLYLFVMVFNHKSISNQQQLQNILSLILSCNSYPPIGSVYESLDKNLSSLGISINYNFRGLFDE